MQRPLLRCCANVASTRRCAVGDVKAISNFPADFTPHKQIAKQIADKNAMLKSGQIDWATAEALAFGTLLMEG